MPTIYDNGWEYDALLMGHVAARELEFYRSEAQRSAVLELACGIGRLTLPLAKAGIEIVGIDLAPSLLETARAKASREGLDVLFLEADVCHFSLNRRFELIFFPNNSLGHLHTLEDVQACFACVRQHLAPDGRFVVDMFNPSLSLLTRLPEKHYSVGEFPFPDGSYITITETVAYDAATQINHALWHYHHEDGSVNLRSLDLRMFFPQELNTLLALGGFSVEAKYGDYSRTPFTSDARQQIVVCRQSR